MKKICKVKPDSLTCYACAKEQRMFTAIHYCFECDLNKRKYELLQIGSDFWNGDYAMVLYNGEIKKVSLSRVYDIKEVDS